MNFIEFTQKICEEVANNLTEKHQVRIQTVDKNNGLTLTGLVILYEEHNLSPTIYLEQFFNEYENGASISDVVGEIISLYNSGVTKKNIDINFFRCFEKVKDKLCYKLISKELNLMMLKNVPYIDYLDMAIVFFYHYSDEDLGTGTILIHNNHLQMWNVTVEDIYRYANENTPVIYPMICEKMGNVLLQLINSKEDMDREFDERSFDGGQLDEEELNEIMNSMKMWVITNSEKVYGATTMIYPGVMDKMCEVCDSSFYIFPSSIHELIIVPYEGVDERERFADMIYEINHTQVERCELLSDSLYFYDRDLREILVL